MQKIQLGQSDLFVTPICLGTMTFGEQVSEPDAHAILDRSLERGVNFLDTAEIYAVPTRAETFGATETIIGHWFRKHPGVRQKLVLTTAARGDLFGERTKEVFPGCPEIRDGAMWSNERPGLGIDVDEALAAKFPFPEHPINGAWPEIRRAILAVHRPQGGNTVVVLSVIDNLVKGAAGQAVQNMNLIFGIDECAGLKLKATGF